MKIALVVPHTFHVKAFWLKLVKELLSSGNTVHVYSAHDEFCAELEKIGAVCRQIPIDRFVAPGTDMRMLIHLIREFKRERYDIIHNITIKPNVFGAIAARTAGCPKVINTVMGFGHAFSGKRTLKAGALKRAASFLYRLGFAASTKTCFVNRDDLREALNSGMLKQEKAVIINGAPGIDLEAFSRKTVEPEELRQLRKEVGLEPDNTVVLMAARMFWSKGIKEFVEAARILEKDFPKARFLLVGGLEQNDPEAVPVSYLERQTGAVRWLGFRKDMRLLMAMADIFTLPSFYKEGWPVVLLEAAASSKPVVTTDNVGCREAVRDGWNGFLVPVKDSKALAEGLRPLLRDAALRQRLGENSRLMVERDFDVKVTNRRIMRELYELPETDPRPEAQVH